MLRWQGSSRLGGAVNAPLKSLLPVKLSSKPVAQESDSPLEAAWRVVVNLLNAKCEEHQNVGHLLGIYSRRQPK